MLKKRDWVYEEGKGGEVILVRLLQSNQHSAHRVFVTYIHALFDAQITQEHSICALYKCLMRRIASLNMFSSVGPCECAPVFSVGFTSSDKAALHLVRRGSSNKVGANRGQKAAAWQVLERGALQGSV